jgi:hypothetical protein
VTEEEAKTKACCGAPAIASATLLASSHAQAEPLPGLKWGHCIGAECMAWRTSIRIETRHRDGHVVQPGEVYLRGSVKTHEVADGGFCGLAGGER